MPWCPWQAAGASGGSCICQDEACPRPRRRVPCRRSGVVADVARGQREGRPCRKTGQAHGDRGSSPPLHLGQYNSGGVAERDGGRAPTAPAPPTCIRRDEARPHRVSGATAVVAQTEGRATPQAPRRISGSPSALRAQGGAPAPACQRRRGRRAGRRPGCRWR